VPKIPQLKVGNPGRVTSGLKPRLYIYETSTSFRTRKDIFTGTSLLIEDLSLDHSLVRLG